MTRQELMHKIRTRALASLECNLYLDTHPDDRRALEYFRKLTAELEELCAQYEKEYNAPISAASAANMDGGWQWVKQPWPWEEEV